MSIDIPTTYRANISVPIGQLSPILDWCQRNCDQSWKWDSSEHDSSIPDYDFFFESEKDYVAFMMWKK